MKLDDAQVTQEEYDRIILDEEPLKNPPDPDKHLSAEEKEKEHKLKSWAYAKSTVYALWVALVSLAAVTVSVFILII